MTAQNYTHDAPCQNIKDLQFAIEHMDCHSQAGFDRIELLATLALDSLELPLDYHRIVHLGEAFLAIKHSAQVSMNDINAIAEGVGCHSTNKFEDERSRARSDVAHKATGKKVGMEGPV